MLETTVADALAFTQVGDLVFSWACTYLMHSTLLLGAVWAATRWVPALRTPSAEDALWKVAAVGALLTASFQLVSGAGVQLSGPDRLSPPSQEHTDRLDRVAEVIPPLFSSHGDRSTAPSRTPSAGASPSRTERPSEGSRNSAAPKPDAVTVPPPESQESVESESKAGSGIAKSTVPWGWILAGVWALGVFVMGLRRWGGRRRFLNRAAPRRAVQEECTQRVADQVAAAGGVPETLRQRTCLTMSKTLVSPVALLRSWRTPEICLPARAGELPEERLRSILAHEWAHLMRRDPEWLWVLTVVECLCWFQPLNRLARRRQQSAAEHLADAWAVHRTGGAERLAASLLDVATWIQTSQSPQVGSVSGMAGDHSSLTRRVETLLDATSGACLPTAWSRWTRSAVAIGLLGLVACAGPSASPKASAPPPAAPSESPPEAEEVEYERAERTLDSAAAASDGAADRAVGREQEIRANERRMRERRIRERQMQESEPQERIMREREVDSRRISSRTHLRTDKISPDSIRRRVRWSSGSRTVEIEMTGPVELQGSGAGIASLGENGRLRVVETANGTTKRLLVTPGETPDQRNVVYTEDGERTPFDAEARQWMEERLLEAMRRTGIAAESRVSHLLSTEGIETVLDEMEEVTSDVAARQYVVALLMADITDEERSRALERAAIRIQSDVEMRQVLETVLAERPVMTDRLYPSFVEALASMDSDVEVRRVLVSLLSDESLTPDQQDRALQLLDRVDSDVETRRIIDSLSKTWSPTDASVSTLINLFGEIDSDVELRRIVESLSRREGYSPSQRARILSAARAIDSDVELRRVVTDVARRGSLEEPVFDAVMSLVSTLDSDHETRRALTSLFERGDPTPGRLVMLLDETRQIDSDREKATLLRRVSSLQNHESEEVRAAYQRAVASVDSDRERDRLQ